MIKCEHLVKKYMSTTAVSDLSLDIISGNIYALLGPNGSGKSTLMKMIAGLSKPTSGTITMDNRPLDYKAKAHIAYMPTEAYFFGYMNCIDVGKYYRDFFADFDYDKYMRLLQEMDLSPKQKVREMSSGMMAKLKIVATLSRNSEVIMLDEPLNGIDIIAREKIIHTIVSNISVTPPLSCQAIWSMNWKRSLIMLSSSKTEPVYYRVMQKNFVSHRANPLLICIKKSTHKLGGIELC